MDTFITRYSHMGVSYVHDSYTGRTLPADVYDTIMESRPSISIAPVVPKTHPLLRKRVKFHYGSEILVGRFVKIETLHCVIKVDKTTTYYISESDIIGKA